MVWVQISDIKSILGIVGTTEDNAIGYIINTLDKWLYQKYNFNPAKLGLTNQTLIFDSENTKAFAYRNTFLYSEPWKTITNIAYSSDQVIWETITPTQLKETQTGFVYRIVLDTGCLSCVCKGIYFVRIIGNYADFAIDNNIIYAYAKTYQVYKDLILNGVKGQVTSESDHTTSVSYSDKGILTLQDILGNPTQNYFLTQVFDTYDFSNHCTF